MSGYYFPRIENDYIETKVYFTSCRECGWEHDESFKDQADCTVTVCPACGNDWLEDNYDWR